MQVMQNFCVWFLEQLPAFLMTEPIIYFVGLFFSFFIVKLIMALCSIGSRNFRF